MNTNGKHPTPALKLEHVSFTYSGAKEPALHDINLEIPHGSSVAIIGPNGAGKTTLFNAILGLLRLDQGTISVNGRSPHSMRRQIAYMPQRDAVDWQFPLTVFDIALMGRVAHVGWRLRARKADFDAAQAALERVDMWSKRHLAIAELSGGQQQRLIIARALAQDAPLFLLDEPFNQVDVSTQHLLLELFDELVANGRTLLVTTHDLELARTRFPRVLFLNRSVKAFGTPAEMFTPENLTKTYTHQVVNWESDSVLSLRK